MIRMDITGLDEVMRNALKNGEKHARFVTMRSMNDLAFTIMREGRARLEQVLDRPTPYTTKSWRVRKMAKKNDLTMGVGMSDWLSDKASTGPDAKLEHHFVGGQRIPKRLEMRMQILGMLKAGEYLVQGEGARVNTFGNMIPGQVAQIFSQLGLQIESGYDSKPTGSKSSKRNVAKAGKIFWSKGDSSSRQNSLPRGVWMRNNNGLHALLIAVSKTRYRRRFNLDKFGAFITKRDLDDLFKKHWQKAIETAL